MAPRCQEREAFILPHWNILYSQSSLQCWIKWRKVLLLLPHIILCYGTLCHPNSHSLSHLYKMSVQWLSRNLGQVQESPSAPVGEEWDQTVNAWQTPSKETSEHNLDTYESQSQLSSFKLKTLDSPLSHCNEAFIYSVQHPFRLSACIGKHSQDTSLIYIYLKDV